MALARVQATTAATTSGGSSVVLTFSTNPTVGNGLVVAATAWNGSGLTFPPTGCTDNKGNTYYLAETRINGGHAVALYYCEAIVATGSSFTVTVAATTGGSYYTGQAYEVSGIGTGLTPHVTAGATGSSTTPATGATDASAVADLYAVGLCVIQEPQGSLTVESVSPSWSQEYEQLSFTGIYAAEADYRLLTSMSGSTTSASWTGTASDVWSAIVVGFASLDDVPTPTTVTRVRATPAVAVAPSTTIPIPFNVPPAVGHGVIVVATAWSGGAPTFPSGGCADNKGNSYTQAITQVNGDLSVAIYYCASVATGGSGFTVTVTPSTNAYCSGQAIEVSGVGSGLVVELAKGATGTSTTPATGTSAASTAAALFVVALHQIRATQSSITVESVSPAWRQEYEHPSNVVVGSEADSRALTGMTGSTTSASWTDASSAAWAAVLVAFTTTPPPTARVTQSVVEVLLSEVTAVTAQVTQAAVEVLTPDDPAARLTQHVIEVLYSAPPEGGGAIDPGPPPPSDPQVGDVYRLFFTLRGGTPHAELNAAETTLRDPPEWYGGFKGARLVKVSPITRELAPNGELHGVEVTVTLADTDRGVRNLAWTGTLTGAYGAIYVVSDETRYALGEPYRLFAGIVQEHRALPGFQYEFRLLDTLSMKLADLDSAPRIPPDRLALADFPGMAPEAEGRAVPIVLGEASDETSYLPDRGPQGVVPPTFLGTVNFADAWGGSDLDVDAYIWSAGALVTPGGVWGVYYNNAQPLGVASLTGSGTTATLTTSAPHQLTALDAIVVSGATPEEYNGTWPVTIVDATTVTYTAAASLSGPASGAAVMPARAVRTPVPASSWGVDVWTPGKPGWAMTGLTTDYADYHGRRYTPFFVRRDHPLAEAARTGQIFVAGNLFGLAEHGDGTGHYLDDPPRVWQWILINQLFVPYQTGDYADMPLLDELYGIIDSDSVEAAVTAQHARLAGGYPVGFLLGRNGEQQTLRHVLTELCYGSDMEQGLNRHGQAMVSVEDVDAPAIATFTDVHDIEDGEFEVWLDHDAYRNRIEHTYGFRYVPPSAPGVAPAEGAPLPRRVQSFDDWTSGLVVREDLDAITAVGGRRRTMVVENYVVRNPIVADDLETRWLARWVGPTFDGPMRFRLRTSWQGLGVNATPIELGSVIAITHLEGIGPEGWIAVRGRVLRIEVDPQAARVTLEGRVIAGLPEGSGGATVGLESGDGLLLETGDGLLLEGGVMMARGIRRGRPRAPRRTT